MQVLLAIVAILMFAVAIFAFQNPDTVTVRFLYWQLSATVAVVTIASAAAGALAATLASLAARFVRWTRRPAPVARASVPAAPPPPPPTTAPPPSRP